MESNSIFVSETSIYKHMQENGIRKIRMYITAYVSQSGQQNWGFSISNINSNYYLKQKSISRKTKTFNLNAA